MSSKNNEKLFDYSLTNIAAILSILTPILYAFGYMYEQGYLNQYGLSSDYVSTGFQDYLFLLFWVFAKTFLGLFNISSTYLWWFAGYFLLVPLTIFVVTNKRVKRLIRKCVINTKKKVKNNEIAFVSVASLYTYYLIIKFGGIGLFLLSALLIMGVAPYQLGQESAQKAIDKFVACDIKNTSRKNQCTYLYKDKKEILSGALIFKSGSQIGIWNGKETIIYPLNDEVIVIQKAK